MKLRNLAAMSAALMFAAPLPVLAQSVVQVTPARGATTTTVTGRISGPAYIDYRVSVRAGQRLDIALRPLAGSPYFNVLEPGSRDEAIHNSSMGDQRYSGVAARSGAYTVRVYQMRASGRRGTVIRYRLSIGVVGQAVATSSGSTDALVPGTPYHATASVRCGIGPEATMTLCKAGVVRWKSAAVVHLDIPDGGERLIVYRGLTPVSSDSDRPLTVERRGDTALVRIGTAERYEIVDALIAGG